MLNMQLPIAEMLGKERKEKNNHYASNDSHQPRIVDELHELGTVGTTAGSAGYLRVSYIVAVSNQLRYVTTAIRSKNVQSIFSLDPVNFRLVVSRHFMKGILCSEIGSQDDNIGNFGDSSC